MPIVIAFENTDVAAEKTASQIEDMLGKHGAKSTMKEFDDRGRPCALAFQMQTPEGLLPFKLPINIDPVYQLLIAKKSYDVDEALKARVYAQAERTAWRIVRAWVHAQLTLIQTRMVTVVEVFMPYMLLDGDETAYQRLVRGGMPALMAPRDDS